jgi:hypothetical protein
MITLKEWMEATGFRITEGGDYGWDSYGPNSYRLDSWNGQQDGHSASIVFDTRTHEVYEVQVHDYTRTRAYRLINPKYLEAHQIEAGNRDVAFGEAWDDVDYVDLEVESDMMEKNTAIFNNEEYDTRVQVPVDFSDEELFSYMKLAHERDITFNQLVEQALTEAIRQHQL